MSPIRNRYLAQFTSIILGVLTPIFVLLSYLCRAMHVIPRPSFPFESKAKREANCRFGVNWLACLLGFASIFFYAARSDAENSSEYVRKVAYSARNDAIAVVYSDIGEPYRTVFMQIISGIEERTESQVTAYSVGRNPDVEALKGQLRRQGTKVIVALGWQGMKTTVDLDLDVGIVIGGVISATDAEVKRFPVFSLSPNPALLFSRLKGLMPSVRRIYTVYDPNRNAWLIDLAKQDARKQGLELVAREASDLRSAVRVYQEIFQSADSHLDVLWLPQDSTTVEDGSVLPLVLQESWDHNLAVFSSNAGHVRRGVLFSLYPDNVLLGRHLANAALNFLASGEYGERGLILLSDVQMAINLRSAQHQGLNIGGRQNFGMVFPDR